MFCLWSWAVPSRTSFIHVLSQRSSSPALPNMEQKPYSVMKGGGVEQGYMNSEWWISANASHWMALVSVCAIWREHVCHKRHSPSHRGTPTRCSATQFSLKLCSAQRAHFKLHSLGAYTSKMWPPGLRCALWLICLGLFVLALTHGNWLLLWPESFVFLLPVISQSLFPHFEKTMQKWKVGCFSVCFIPGG